MKIRLARIMDAMLGGGYLNMETGEITCLEDISLEISRLRNQGKYPPEKGYWFIPEESHMFIPAVNEFVILDEFIKMQSITQEILDKYAYQFDNQTPLLVFEEQAIKNLPLKFFWGDITGYIDHIGMEPELFKYFDMRLAGIARKWGQENGLEIIENFPRFGIDDH